MAFVETPATALSDDQDTIPAATANIWKRDIARSLDMVGGSDGVPATPATVIDIAGTQGLRLSGTGAAVRLRYGSHSVTRVQTGPLYNITAASLSLPTVAVAPAQVARQNLDRVPDDATITGVTVYFIRAATGILPGTRVQAALYKIDITTGTEVEIVADTADPTSTIGPYEAHHGFTISPGSPEVVDNERYIYFVRVKGELAGNTSTITLYPCRVATTVTSQDEAP